MDHGTSVPRIYLKQPSARPIPSRTSNERGLNAYSGSPSVPTVNYGKLPKASVLSQVVSAAGATDFGFSGAKPNARSHGWTPTVPPSHQQNPQQARYNYGPSSTSASISASTASSQHHNIHPTINHGSYKSIKSGKVPQTIEYHNDTSKRTESRISVRQGSHQTPVVYLGGRGAKVAPQTPTQPDQGKFFQISGLKVRKEFAAGQKDNAIPDSKKTLALMPPPSLNNASYSPPSSLVSRSSSPASDPPEPYVHARVPMQFDQTKDTNSSGPSSSVSNYNPVPKTFYSSLVGSKGFSLSLASSRQPSHLGPLKVPSSHSGLTSDDLDQPDDPGAIVNELNLSENPVNVPMENGALQVKQARSDRKIMDLEISNASLMSVNKYLEKKLRSQAKDIQYLKISSKNDVSGQIPEFDTDSDTGNSENEDEDMIPSEEVSMDSIMHSPSELEFAEKTKLIEERMQSHINFLESSEKVNKMMLNCLLISGSLLQQASESLEYEVNPSDVKFGLQVARNTFIHDSGDSSFNDSVIDASDSSFNEQNPKSSSHVDMTQPMLGNPSKEEEESGSEGWQKEDDSETVNGDEGY